MLGLTKMCQIGVICGVLKSFHNSRTSGMWLFRDTLPWHPRRKCNVEYRHLLRTDSNVWSLSLVSITSKFSVIRISDWLRQSLSVIHTNLRYCIHGGYFNKTDTPNKRGLTIFQTSTRATDLFVPFIFKIFSEFVRTGILDSKPAEPCKYQV